MVEFCGWCLTVLESCNCPLLSCLHLNFASRHCPVKSYLPPTPLHDCIIINTYLNIFSTQAVQMDDQRYVWIVGKEFSLNLWFWEYENKEKDCGWTFVLLIRIQVQNLMFSFWAINMYICWDREFVAFVGHVPDVEIPAPSSQHVFY